MKIALAQQNYHIGNFEENTRKIIEGIKWAKSQNADLQFAVKIPRTINRSDILSQVMSLVRTPFTWGAMHCAPRAPIAQRVSKAYAV